MIGFFHALIVLTLAISPITSMTRVVRVKHPHHHVMFIGPPIPAKIR